MQQNAGQQGTIADAVVAQAAPVQAAYGGEMHGYAGGGAVAFQDAGVVGLQNPEYDEEGLPRSNEERQRIERNNRIFLEQKKNTDALRQRQAQAEAVRQTSQPVPQQMLDFYRSTGRDRAVTLGMPESAATTTPMRMQDTRGGTPEMAALAQMLGTDAAQRTGAAPGTGQQRPPAAPAAAAPAAPMPGIRATLTPEEQRMYDERKAALEGRKTLPADLLAGRAGLSALMQKNLAEERAEAETFGKEALAARDAALARAQRDVFSDPMALLGLAGTIDTRKGQGMGSFARGLSGIMGQREAAAEAARKEYATAQGTMRVLQANIRRGSMLEAQRVQAMNEQDYTRVSQLDDAIAQNAAERAKLEREVQNKAFDQALESRKAAATERQARASEISVNKPPAELALMEWLRDPKNKKLYEEIQGVKQAPRTRQELMEQWSKNFMLQQRYPNFDDFAAAMNVAGATGAGAGEFKVLSSRPK